MREYYVYITTNHTGSVLYTGLTNALGRRAGQHRLRTLDGFTKRYKADKLVYYESTTDIRAAIQREKEIKGWSRPKKIALIDSMNPRWKDLADVESETLEGGPHSTPTDSFAKTSPSAHGCGRRSE